MTVLTSLDKLLRPATIAVVGASEKSGFSGSLCNNLMKWGNPDNVYFVSSSRESVLGKKCYATLADIPTAIDMAVICIPKRGVLPLLHQMAELNIKAGVVLASGYSETGKAEDKKDEQELIALANKLDIALMGPNCAGFINFGDKAPCFGLDMSVVKKTGGVSVLSQSGQVCMTVLDMGRLNFSFVISAGNSSVVTLEAYLEYLIHDPRTKVVALYMEGITDPRKFIDALKLARQKRKPIVVLKTGSSQKGTQIASSHTGSLAGSDSAYSAIFKKYGVIRVADMEELIATSLLFSTLKELPKTSGFASMNLSGGETALCADLGEVCGLSFPDFAPETLTKLKDLLPSYATPNNPLDTTASLSYDPPGYAKLLKTVMEDDNVGMVLCGFNILPFTDDPCITCMAEGIELAMKSGTVKPMALISFAECSREAAIVERLQAVNVPVMPSSLYSLRIMRYLTEYVEYLSTSPTLEDAIPTVNNSAKTRRSLSEKSASVFLEQAGIPVSPSALARAKEELSACVQATGFPVVAKICSPDILHKSDIGGVQVNITTLAGLEEAYDAIMANAAKCCPKARIEGILVQKMAKPGTEMLIGVNVDPQFGPMVMCGMGGVFVEIFKDVALYPAPFHEQEAAALLSSLQSFKLLTGYRGQKTKDIQALAKTIAKVSRFAADNKDTLAEMDINPILVYEDGLCAVDALIINYA